MVSTTFLSLLEVNVSNINFVPLRAIEIMRGATKKPRNSHHRHQSRWTRNDAVLWEGIL